MVDKMKINEEHDSFIIASGDDKLLTPLAIEQSSIIPECKPLQSNIGLLYMFLATICLASMGLIAKVVQVTSKTTVL